MICMQPAGVAGPHKFPDRSLPGYINSSCGVADGLQLTGAKTERQFHLEISFKSSVPRVYLSADSHPYPSTNRARCGYVRDNQQVLTNTMQQSKCDSYHSCPNIAMFHPLKQTPFYNHNINNNDNVYSAVITAELNHCQSLPQESCD